jgi:glycosyltransferase involved in cell wall biosynthesis
MSIPKITILIPTYQRPKFLVRAIDSIASQSFSDLIIRVHDNGSDYETKEAVSNLMLADPRIEYHRHVKNIGVLGNFQSLIDTIKTPFYSIISDDDFYLPGHIKTGVENLIGNPEAYFYASATATANFTNDVLYLRNQYLQEGFYTPSKKLSQLIAREHFTSTGTIFSIKIKDKISYFHQLAMDNVFSIMLTGCMPFLASPRIGAVFTINKKITSWDHIPHLTIDQILRSSAFDGKFVGDNSSSEIKPFLLEYLKVIYNELLEARANYIGRFNIKDDGPYLPYLTLADDSKILKFLSRNSLIKYIKYFLPELVIRALSDFRLITNKNQISLKNFNHGIEYLKNCDISQKNTFINKFFSLAPQRFTM